MKKNIIIGIVLSTILALEIVFLFIPFFTNKSGDYSPMTSFFKYYLPITKSNFRTTLFLIIFLIEFICAIVGVVGVFKKDEKNNNIETISLVVLSILFLVIFTMNVAVPK